MPMPLERTSLSSSRIRLAALDDANVGRFAQYLRRVSDKTQFIVITHRRGTMEAANVLYGVTMQEDGVSKLLKLDLEHVDATLVS